VDSTARLGPGSTRLVHISAGREAALYIRRLIFDGDLPAGSRVPQGEIAEALGISRIPVREAIVALEREGLVTLEPHRGAFVAVVDRAMVRDNYELFGLVYGFAAQRTAERADEKVVEEIKTALDNLTAAQEPLDVLQRTYEFNGHILNVGGTPRLRVLAEMMSGILPGNLFELIEGAIEIGKLGSAATYLAIRQHDGDAAFASCRSMMSAHGDLAVEYLAARGLFDREAS
jgi:DNA-binding GntR family transcriptional regulator